MYDFRLRNDELNFFHEVKLCIVQKGVIVFYGLLI